MQIWLIAVVIGSLRALYGVIMDLISAPIIKEELIVDGLLTLAFVSITIGIYRGVIKKIPILITIVLIVLLCINMVQFGGVEGMTDFNLFGLGAFIILGHHKKDLKFLLPFYITCVLLVLLDGITIKFLQSVFFIELLHTKEDFIVITLSIGALVYYFKYAMVNENTYLSQQKIGLKNKIEIRKNQLEAIDKQRKQLLLQADSITEELNQQSDELNKHHSAINNHMNVVKKKMEQPVKELLELCEELVESNPYDGSILQSAKELERAIHQFENPGDDR
ncbi:hypothetical protein SAMN05421640_1283 [Ekhidna lutea]|uniref:Uncharacterized protein n=2 Tax=Ekhidna lutea TaxID=447679 RepID=A0A239HFV3_EKHLU|nr:hypothetical protein SAMN05421640_1283 [Ekhidna lutea]